MADQRALLKPAARVTGQKLDVWYVKNELLRIAIVTLLSENCVNSIGLCDNATPQNINTVHKPI